MEGKIEGREEGSLNGRVTPIDKYQFHYFLFQLIQFCNRKRMLNLLNT